MLICVCFFFFKQKTAYEMRISDWSSDVCSSDLVNMRLDRFSASTRLLCSAASGLAMLAGSASALAQEAGDTESDENAIVVTGYRASIENSLDAKRDATGIVEVISAEDIGKLPDLSIADALARLPGVTAQRVRGRSQQISIRGLGPACSLALLNGREEIGRAACRDRVCKTVVIQVD